MEPLHRALIYLQQRRCVYFGYTEAAEWAGKALAKNELDEAAWVVKMRALSETVYVDEAENEEDGLAEALLDDVAIAAVPRPGTSLAAPRTAGASPGQPSPAVRPRTNTGRPLSGFVRPGTQSGRPGTVDQALGGRRTAATARPLTSASGRHLRLGTASMLPGPDAQFINVSRLNLSKYAARPSVAKPLFEYLFYHENDIRNALQLASLATQAANFKDWFWKVQLGKCYYRLGMYRDAEKQLKSAAGEELSLEVTLLLGKVYTRLDQPLSAMDAFKTGLDSHPNDVRLLTGLARLHEGVNDLSVSVEAYKRVLAMDATNVESIASIATHYFYADQPEVALRFYRRLLQMGVKSAELYCNLGLCCFYAQQWDLAVGCIERALALAEGPAAAEVWYNVGHVALGGGDAGLAYRCFRLALALDPAHLEAVTNLGVVHMRQGKNRQATALFKSAMTVGAYSFEPFFNYALLSYQMGDIEAAYGAVKRSLDIFPEHADSIELKRRLDKLLTDV